MILDKINDLIDLSLVCITDHLGSAFCVNFLYMAEQVITILTLFIHLR